AALDVAQPAGRRDQRLVELVAVFADGEDLALELRRGLGGLALLGAHALELLLACGAVDRRRRRPRRLLGERADHEAERQGEPEHGGEKAAPDQAGMVRLDAHVPSYARAWLKDN